MKNEASTLRNWYTSFKRSDLVLLSVILSLLVFGLIMVYSASFIFAQERYADGYLLIRKQMFCAGLGLLALVIGASIPQRFWREWSPILLAGCTLLLALLLVPGVGVKVGGAQRWLRLGAFQFQPAELAKFILIAFAARQIQKKRYRMNRFVPSIISPFILLMPALVLILFQPDFGNFLLIVTTVMFLIYLSGVRLSHIAIAIFAALTIVGYLALRAPYRAARLTTFLNPWQDPSGSGFQILQSLVGFHNGGFMGTGLGNGKEKLFYLPEAHHDFIFAVIGEEVGWIGVTLVALGFLFFVLRGIRISRLIAQEENQFFTSLFAAGLTLIIGFRALGNMAVVLGLLPTKGIGLPFISYGGTALVMDLFIVGVLLNISQSNQIRESVG